MAHHFYSLDQLRETLLMGPGPSCIPPQVYDAIARPTIGHLDPRFIRIMDDIKAMLREVMNTTNVMTLPMSGT
ncbi:MAG: alanine--glyoxylate aminotransferase family protein, partial [Lentisphaerae bacterium]